MRHRTQLSNRWCRGLGLIWDCDKNLKGTFSVFKTKKKKRLRIELCFKLCAGNMQCLQTGRINFLFFPYCGWVAFRIRKKERTCNPIKKSVFVYTSWLTERDNGFGLSSMDILSAGILHMISNETGKFYSNIIRKTEQNPTNNLSLNWNPKWKLNQYFNSI